MKKFKQYLEAKKKDWKDMPDDYWVLVDEDDRKVIKVSKNLGGIKFTSSRGQEKMRVSHAKKKGYK